MTTRLWRPGAARLARARVNVVAGPLVWLFTSRTRLNPAGNRAESNSYLTHRLPLKSGRGG